MSGSRGAGPTGLNETALASGASGVLGGGEVPGPLGNQAGIPLDGGAGEKEPTATGIELNLVGSYPRPQSWTNAKELELIRADSWFPHTLDFLAVAGKGSKEIKSPEDFLLKIIEANGQIGRLNFFSHGVTGMISTSGQVDPKGTACYLESGWTQVIGETRIADPYAKTWGDDGENSGSVKITVGDKSFSLDDVRAKFASDAELWLFICHAGADPNLLKNISNTFQVRVRSFSGIIVFCARDSFPASRRHRVNVNTGGTLKQSCDSAFSDFHELSSDRSATPRKP